MEEETTGDTSATESPTIVIDGEEFSAEQVKEGMMRNRDYTQKTQTLANDRKALDADRQTLEARAARSTSSSNGDLDAGEVRTALEADKKWYSEHDVGEWGNYSPQVNRFSEGAPAPVVDPELKKDLSEVKGMLTEDRAAKAKADKTSAIDSMLTSMDAARERFALADEDLVMSKIQAHAAKNDGAMPTSVQVNNIVKSVHDAFVRAGAPVPDGTETTSSKPDIEPGSTAKDRASHADLDLKKDVDDVENELAAFIQNIPDE